MNAGIVIADVRRDVRQENVEHPGNRGFVVSSGRFGSEFGLKNDAVRIFYLKYKICLYVLPVTYKQIYLYCARSRESVNTHWA